MTNVLELIDRLAVPESRLATVTFVAPHVRNGAVRTRIAGLIHTFVARPQRFAGWGIFRPIDVEIAVLTEEAGPALVEGYLRLLPRMRLRLALRLDGGSWLAYPVNESDARQRLGSARPVPVHLVERAAAFERIVARFDGAAWWFEDLDRRADPREAERLRTAFAGGVPAKHLDFAGITPETRAAYRIAASHDARASTADAERRLARALRQGGGALRSFRDRREFWLVEWATSDGEIHTSAISKSDLTVMSAGICLSGRDQDFDLQSIVGVVEEPLFP